MHILVTGGAEIIGSHLVRLFPGTTGLGLGRASIAAQGAPAPLTAWRQHVRSDSPGCMKPLQERVAQ